MQTALRSYLLRYIKAESASNATVITHNEESRIAVFLFMFMPSLKVRTIKKQDQIRDFGRYKRLMIVPHPAIVPD